MPSQGPNTTASWVSDGSGFATWLDPTNAQFSDDSRSTCEIIDLDDYSDGLSGTSWGFTVPGDATIDGVEMTVELVKVAGDPLIDNGVFLFKVGPAYSLNRAIFTDMPAVEGVRTYGSPTDKWGFSTLTPSDVNNNGFGGLIGVLSVTGFPGTAGVDQITLTVYYTPAGAPWGGRQLAQARAISLRALRARDLARVRRAIWSGADVVVFEVPVSGDLFVNAARRLNLRGRTGRRRVLAWQEVLEEAPPEVLDTVERLVHAMRRAELRHGRSVRAVLRVISMDGGHGEGPFVVELPTLRALGEFTKREIWAQTGLKPGEPPPWRRRR